MRLGVRAGWDAPRPTVEVLTATYAVSEAERVSVFNVFEQFDGPGQGA
jgi:hypothetical protein